MIRKFSIVLLSLFVFLISSLCLAQSFKAGTAKIEIVPEKPAPLGGYGGRYAVFKGVHDPVYARALILDNGKVKLGIVSTDLLMILKDLKDEISAKISDLNLDALMLSATHSHSAPAGYIDIPAVKIAVSGPYHPDVRKMLVERISSVIREADKNMKPAKFGSIIGEARGYAINRRHPENGPVDPALGLIKIADLEGNTIAYIINYTAHPTIFGADNLYVSGDLAGAVERAVEEADKGAIALYFSGAIGDQGPNCNKGEKSEECLKRLSFGLTEEVKKLKEQISLKDQLNIKIFDRMVKMPEAKVREKGCTEYKLLKSLAKNLIRDEAEFMAIELNDTLIYASPAELAVEVGFKLKALHPEKKVLIASHSNDWVGYLLLKKEYEEVGGYEACMSIYGSDFEPYFVEQFKELTAN